VTTLIFGSTDSEFVRASFGERPYRNAEHPFDRNQVIVLLDLVIRPFQASFEAMWLVESFSTFRSELERSYNSLEGEARFFPDYSKTLEVTLAGDGIGHFTIKGDVCANPATGPWFRFNLPTIDQTYLPDMISTLLELEKEYPAL
jgi:hypothetical protein